jgi:hypothetical protein
MGSDENAVQELRMNRSSKVVKGKRKVETKRARVERRAVPERMRSKPGVEEVTNGEGYYGPRGSGDNAAGSKAAEAIALATHAAPTAPAFAALQAWFLLPLRNLQSWQDAWFRLLPR